MRMFRLCIAGVMAVLASLLLLPGLWLLRLSDFIHPDNDAGWERLPSVGEHKNAEDAYRSRATVR